MSNARENVNLLASADFDIAALRLANWGAGAVPPQVVLKQNWVAGDGGGLFRHDASDTTTADNGGTVIVDAAGNRWKRQYDGAVHVTWFGVKPNDQTNSVQTANASALVAAFALEKGVYVSPGDYYFNARIDVNDKSVSLFGDDPRAARLIWTVATGGVRVFDNTQGGTYSVAKRHYFANLSFLTTQAGGGQPLYVRASGYSEPSVIINNVHATGFDDSVDYWTSPVELYNCYQTKTTNLYYAGRQNNYTDATGGLKIAQDSGVGAMAHWVVNAQIKFVTTGIDVTHSSATGSGLGIEGVVISNPLILANECIKIEDTNASSYLPPYYVILGGQLDAEAGRCLYAKRVSQVFVSDTVMYGTVTASPAHTGPLVELSDVQDFFVSSTWFGDFQGSGTAKARVGLLLSDTTRRGVIQSGCKFENFSSAISLGASTSTITVAPGQVFVGNTTNVTNAGATNIVESSDNYLSPTATATGTSPVLRALGSDTNINLRLLAKGSGVIIGENSIVAQGASSSVAVGTDGGVELYVNAGNPYIDFKNASGDDFDARIQFASNGLDFHTGGQGSTAVRFVIDSAGTVRPGTDGSQNLGDASYKWNNVYASVGTIQTSGRHAKEQIAALSPALLRAARKLQVRMFKYRAAVQEKGENARWHFGVIHDEVREAFVSEGLDPWVYGVLCVDPVIEVVEEQRTVIRKKPRMEKRTIFVPYRDPNAANIRTAPILWREEEIEQPARNEKDEPLYDDVQEEQTVMVSRPKLDESGNQIVTEGVRYDELFAFVLAALVDALDVENTNAP